MDYGKLGERIREERLKRHMTQEALAEIVGISSVYTGQIERAERRLSIDNLVAIANALHVSIESLLRNSLVVNDAFIDNELYALIKNRTYEEKALILDVVKSILSHTNDNSIR
jgi:transcriptional regulator with XRE-family HTH domain